MSMGYAVVTDKGNMADRRHIVARTCGEYGDYETAFNGPTTGLGPIYTSTRVIDGYGAGRPPLDPVRVERPERFGEEFGPDWVRAFLAN